MDPASAAVLGHLRKARGAAQVLDDLREVEAKVEVAEDKGGGQSTAQGLDALGLRLQLAHRVAERLLGVRVRVRVGVGVRVGLGLGLGLGSGVRVGVRRIEWASAFWRERAYGERSGLASPRCSEPRLLWSWKKWTLTW